MANTDNDRMAKALQNRTFDDEAKMSEDTFDPVYIDYTATTPLAPEVIAAISNAFPLLWGDPGSCYGTGSAGCRWCRVHAGSLTRGWEAITKDTCLVTVMLAKDETGVL